MKKRHNAISFWLLSIFMFCIFVNTGYAEEDKDFSITIMPARQVTVKGDVEKFKSHQWMSDNFSGGIRNLSFDKEYENDTLLSFEGHSIPNENDNGAEISLKNEDFGSLDFHYNIFRKYFDNSGGFYHPFSTLETNDLSRELELDIEHMSFAISPTIGGINGVTLLFERHRKDGEKSRLNWAGAKEGSTTVEITPTWQDIDEEVNIVALQGEMTVAGFDLSAEQRYEKMDINNVRYERYLSTNSTASEKKQRFQDQRPDSQVWTTTLEGKKWFDDDKAFAGLAYRYNTIDNNELESIVEADEFGNPTNYSHAKTVTNATADNQVNEHTVVGHFMKQVSPTFKISAKMKNQYMERDSESNYFKDTSPTAPDGVIDSIDYSTSRNRLLQFGQNLAFQYTGIKQASIYGDIAVNTMRNNIEEDQHNISRVFQWERVSKAKTQELAYTLGGRFVPSRYFNVTAQLRHSAEDNDYDDKADTSGAINSAFVDSLKTIGNEMTTKLTWKPLSWLHNSFRYQLDNKKYSTRVQDLDGSAEGRYISHTFTYDMFVQPHDDVLLNISYNIQDAKTSTPATSFGTAASTPGFNSDVQSVLLSGSYTPSQEFSFMGAFGYTLSDNFDDYTANALPLGVSNNYTTMELGMNWAPNDKDWSVEPHYAYYDYNTTAVSEFGNYVAQVAWVDFNLKW